MTTARKHRVSVVCAGQTVDGWESYQIQDSMIEPAGAFTLTRPFSTDAWRILRRDARVTITIDGTRILTGPIDKRRKQTKANTIQISGRCFGGRLVQESAPSISYERMSMLEAFKRLVDPFFDEVVTSDARNRDLRRGRGRKVVGGTEPIVINIPIVRRGRVHPGMTRWAVIEDICTAAGYIAWGSADGTEFFIGKPNYNQPAQFLFCNAKPNSTNKTTVKDLTIEEDNGDRYSEVVVVGTGGGDDANYGANVDRSAKAADGPNPDGTGRDFIFPKRMMMPERDFDSNQDAKRVAAREMARRDFKREMINVVMPDHGQLIGGLVRTIYAPNTIARVIDEDTDVDSPYLIYAVSFEANSKEELTTMDLVPSGTEILL